MVNFTNNLWAAFWYKSVLSSFSVLTLRFVIFRRKDIGAKAARKMLVKLTPDLFLRHGLREIVDDEVGAGSLVREVASHGWLTTSCRRRQHLHPVLHNCAGLPNFSRICFFLCCANAFFCRPKTEIKHFSNDVHERPRFFRYSGGYVI